MLFLRTYMGLNGGHLKVFHYLAHAAASTRVEPVLYLTPGSQEPPEDLLPPTTPRVPEPFAADAFFIGGFNWRMLDAAGIDTTGKPVVNLLQGLRHALPDDQRSGYLARPALRICVSSAVHDAVLATGEVRGPIVTIPNGLDATELERFALPTRATRVFIAGAKNAPLAHEVAAALTARGLGVEMRDHLIPRAAFLRELGSCDISVLLPDPHEGFFLPALEAMALGSAVVIPPCSGASDYCVDERTCLIPAPSSEAIVAAVLRLRADPVLAEDLRRTAGAQARAHRLERERASFLETLDAYLTGAVR